MVEQLSFIMMELKFETSTGGLISQTIKSNNLVLGLIYKFFTMQQCIVQDTGASYLQYQVVYCLKSQTDNDEYIKCIEDGAVELYHNNTNMASTTTNGYQS